MNMDAIGMHQRGLGSYNNWLFRRPIRFDIGFILVLLEARLAVPTATCIIINHFLKTEPTENSQ